MRPVKFNKWIPPQFEDEKPRQVLGTGCWEKDFPNSGMFHIWANACDESEDDYGNYTVALVELADGTVAEVLPSNLKFVDNIEINFRD